MKKCALIFTLLLFFTTISAQISDTDTPVTGFGEFRLGMTPTEFLEELKAHTANDGSSKISGIPDGESTMVITNLEVIGYVFNRCFFTFEESELVCISCSLFFDKKNNFPKEYEELLTALENDYGKKSNRDAKSKEDESAFIWTDNSKAIVMISKRYDKKEKHNVVAISVKKSMLSGTNSLNVYKNK